jgi:ankyrin repeat protein
MGIIFSSKQQADLLAPCMEGNLDEVKRLVGIYIADHRSNSSCRKSSSSSDLCAYINAIDPISGNAAIHGATFSGHLDILSFLVDSRCCGKRGGPTIDLGLKNSLGCSPLWIAAGYDRIDCLQYLIDKLHSSHQLEMALLDGNNTGDTPFLAAASRGNMRACQSLLDCTEKCCCCGGDCDQDHDHHICWNIKKKLLRTANCAGDTALKVAVASGQDAELLTLLLDIDDQCQEQLDKRHDDSNEDAHCVNRMEDDTIMHSKCINRKNKMGLSPLIVACERNQPSSVELLLDRGADIGIRDMTGRSPLAVAAFCGCMDVVELLLNEIDVASSSSSAAAAITTTSTSSSILNDVDNNGCTPLWLAARTGNLSMIKLLVDAGADATKTNKNDMSPLDVAIKFKKDAVVEFLSQMAH